MKPSLASRVSSLILVGTAMGYGLFNAGPATGKEDAHARNVLEYFLELNPEDIGMQGYYGSKPHTEQTIKSWIKIRDIPNGYLLIHPPPNSAMEAETQAEVALFVGKEGNRAPTILVALSNGSSNQIKAFRRSSTPPKWQDVTRAEIPVLSEGELRAIYKRKFPQRTIGDGSAGQLMFKLPRRGSKVSVVSSIDEEGLYGAELYSFTFDGKRFNLDPP